MYQQLVCFIRMSFDSLFPPNDNKELFNPCDEALNTEEITDIFVGLDLDCPSELSSLSDSESKHSEQLDKPTRKKLIIGKHIKINEGEHQKFTCTICNSQFSRKQQARYHDYCVTGKRPLKCELCAKRFVKKSHLLYHLRTHTGESPFKCDVCQKGFKQQAKLKRHKQIHSNDAGSRLTCLICKKTYSDKDALKKHVQKHSALKTYSCSNCSKSYTDKFTLKQHMNSHKIPGYICEICGKSFLRKNSLNVHMQIHEDVYPFECNECQKTFRSKKELNQHSIVHNRNNPGHECSMCNTTCGRRDNLLRHIRNCHLDPCQKKSQKEPKGPVSPEQGANIDQNKEKCTLNKNPASNRSQVETKGNLPDSNNAIHNKNNATISTLDLDNGNVLKEGGKVVKKKSTKKGNYSTRLIVKLFPFKNQSNKRKKMNVLDTHEKVESREDTHSVMSLKLNNPMSNESTTKPLLKKISNKKIKKMAPSNTGAKRDDDNDPKILDFMLHSPPFGEENNKENSNSANLSYDSQPCCSFKDDENLPIAPNFTNQMEVQNNLHSEEPIENLPVHQKTSVIVHTDSYKSIVLGTNTSREPVIKFSGSSEKISDETLDHTHPP